MRIGIDLMGSDTSTAGIVQHLLAHGHRREGIEEIVCFFGGEEAEALSRSLPQSSLYRAILCPSWIHQDEDPLGALRKKRNSSLMVALEALRDGAIDALISAGNTGAVIAGSALLLPKLSSVRRPSLLAFFPTLSGQIAVLDVGGNLSPSAEVLVQYAHMGMAVQKVLQGIVHPRVALLNVGEESQKGTVTLQEAYQSLTKIPEFVGNREARNIFFGGIDVLVTDGYAGNILLKTAEGASALILSEVERAAKGEGEQEIWNKIVASLYRRFDYQKYPGAIVCGVDALVLKCHGASSPESLSRSVDECLQLHKKGFLPALRKLFSTSANE